MPQMMPLFWAPLFLVFSILLMVSFSKLYFSQNKPFSVSTLESKKLMKTSTTKWMW